MGGGGASISAGSAGTAAARQDSTALRKKAGETIVQADTQEGEQKYRKKMGYGKAIMRQLNLPEPPASSSVSMQRVGCMVLLGALVVTFFIMLLMRKRPRH